MLNFRYLFILFTLISVNSYSVLEIAIVCSFDDDGWCIPQQDVVFVNSIGNLEAWETFNTGFDNTLESINENFNIVADDFPDWEVSGAAGAGNTDWVSLLTSSGRESWGSYDSAYEGYYDAWERDGKILIMEDYAWEASESAWDNSDLAAISTDSAFLKSKSAAANALKVDTTFTSAHADYETVFDTAHDVKDDLKSVVDAQTQALTDVNNKISDMVNSVDGVETKALTDIEQYVSDVLNTSVDVVDYEAVMTTALGTGTGSLNALASSISNAGNSQDNTALVNSLNGLSNSVAGLGSVGTLNAIGDLQGALGNNVGALGGLSDSLTDGDGSGEIGNKSAGLFNNLKNSLVGVAPSFSSSGSSCPTWAFDEGALLVGGLVIDSHCKVIDMIRPSFELAMLSFFSVMGFRVVFSA